MPCKCCITRHGYPPSALSPSPFPCFRVSHLCRLNSRTTAEARTTDLHGADLTSTSKIYGSNVCWGSWRLLLLPWWYAGSCAAGRFAPDTCHSATFCCATTAYPSPCAPPPGCQNPAPPDAVGWRLTIACCGKHPAAPELSTGEAAWCGIFQSAGKQAGAGCLAAGPAAAAATVTCCVVGVQPAVSGSRDAVLMYCVWLSGAAAMLPYMLAPALERARGNSCIELLAVYCRADADAAKAAAAAKSSSPGAFGAAADSCTGASKCGLEPATSGRVCGAV